MVTQPVSGVKESDRTRVPGLIDFAVSVSSADGVTVVEVVGDLDCSTAPDLREALFGVAADAPGCVILDLGGNAFVDSTGLGVLVGAVKRVKEAGGDLVLRSPSRATVRLFEVTGLTDHFEIT